MPVILYGYPSTASLVVHLKLIELCIEHELQPLDSDRREQKSPQYLALNPAGRMPALVIDGQVLIESVAIATHWPTSTPRRVAPAAGTPARGDYCRWMCLCTCP